MADVGPKTMREAPAIALMDTAIGSIMPVLLVFCSVVGFVVLSLLDQSTSKFVKVYRSGDAGGVTMLDRGAAVCHSTTSAAKQVPNPSFESGSSRSTLARLTSSWNHNDNSFEAMEPLLFIW